MYSCRKAREPMEWLLYQRGAASAASSDNPISRADARKQNLNEAQRDLGLKRKRKGEKKKKGKKRIVWLLVELKRIRSTDQTQNLIKYTIALYIHTYYVLYTLQTTTMYYVYIHITSIYTNSGSFDRYFMHKMRVKNLIRG